MRTEWLMDGATWLASWPEGLWRASWQGALCAALVWAVTRLWTRMPASLRAGMWWLVALKFVVSLGGPRPLALPVLPASLAFLSGQAESSESDGAPLVEGGAVGASPVSRGSEGWAPSIGAAHGLVGERDAHVGNLGMVGGAVHLVPAGQSTKAPGAESPRLAEGGQGARMSEAGSPNLTEGGHAIAGGLLKPSTPGARASGAGWKQFVVLALLAAWVVGVLWQVRAQVRSWALMRRLRRNARPLEHPVLESEVLELSESAGLRRAPRLLVSDEVASPLATGLWSPVVVLPTKAVRRLPVEGLRMALAHEVAHLKRGDLWLGWVPALAEALLFFHPLARRAAREYALAREEACDAEALRLTGAEPADYGELLLAFGVTRPHGTAAALGASAHVHALHRRLSMLEHVDIGSSRSRRWLKVTLSALGLVALIPFQVVARQEAKSVAETESKQGSASSTPPALTAVAETRPGGPTSTDSAQPAAVPSRKQGTVRTGTMDAATPIAVASPVAPIAASPVGPRPVAPVAALSPTGPSPVAPMGVASPAGRSLVAPTGVASPVGLRPIAPMAVASPVGPSPVAPVGVASPVGLRPIAPMAVASPSGPSPVAPRPMLSLAAPRAVPLPPRLAMAGVPAAPVAPPTPPSPPDYDDDDDSSYVLLSGDKATMRGSTVDLKLAKMFKDKNGGELLYVRRKGEAFIIRDTATLAAMKAALEPIRKFGLVQGGVGTRMGALGEEQGKLGMKQGALGVQQGQLGLQHAELAHKRAGLHLQSARLDSLSEAERARREAELDKQEAELDKEIDALDAKQEELSKQQEELGREQEKLGKQQEELGREQEKLGKQHENQVRDAEKKVQSVIDEALRKGLGKPLPT
ncbi:M56 family metallopeptidase [Myxococcus sp. CA040A]|uniref:M56 family metallopeptidase n=1 Tax=Myxococcus sp. CA040A TaxID=2741738 RepID=UPI00157B6C27|nr:M56 family metallopeptidase [Myxococcus sp. CA040A]NTX02979.1 peptidase M56 [Myxococcus sp. CA040A]